jgi:hypothetical protein
MAVKNGFVTNNVESKTADKCAAPRCGGSVVKTLFFNFEVEAADDNASVYRIGRLPGTAVPIQLIVLNDAIAGLTNPSFGIYKPLEQGGALIDVDCLMAAADLNAGLATPGTQKFYPAIADVGKDLLSLGGVDDDDKQKYAIVDVAITTAAGVSAAGTISGMLIYADGV